MKALSLIFKGVDNGAIKVTKSLGNVLGEVEDKVEKSTNFFARLNTAISGLSLSKLSEMNEKISGITGAGRGATQEIKGWMQREGAWKAAGSSAKDLSGAVNAVEIITRETNKTFDELGEKLGVWKDHSAGMKEAIEGFKKFEKFVMASNYDTEKFSDTVGELRTQWGVSLDDQEKMANRTVATAKVFERAGDAARVYAEVNDALGEAYNRLQKSTIRGNKSLEITTGMFADASPQVAALGGALAKMGDPSSAESAIGVYKGFLKLREGAAKLNISEFTEEFSGLAASLGVNVEDLYGMADSFPGFVKILTDKMEKMGPSFWKSSNAVELLSGTFSMSENAIYGLNSGLAEAGFNMKDLDSYVKTANESVDAMNTFIGDSKLGLRTFGEQINYSMGWNSRRIMRGFGKDGISMFSKLSKAGGAIGKVLESIGETIKESMFSDTTRGKFLRFGFIAKEEGISAAVADLANSFGLLGGDSPIISSLVYALQGVDPTALFGMVAAIGSIGSALPALAIGLPFIYLMMKALNKAGMSITSFFSDMLDENKREGAIQKLFEGIPAALQEMLPQIIKVVGVLLTGVLKAISDPKFIKGLVDVIIIVARQLSTVLKDIFDISGTLVAALIKAFTDPKVQQSLGELVAAAVKDVPMALAGSLFGRKTVGAVLEPMLKTGEEKAAAERLGFGKEGIEVKKISNIGGLALRIGKEIERIPSFKQSKYPEKLLPEKATEVEQKQYSELVKSRSEAIKEFYRVANENAEYVGEGAAKILDSLFKKVELMTSQLSSYSGKMATSTNVKLQVITDNFGLAKYLKFKDVSDYGAEAELP